MRSQSRSVADEFLGWLIIISRSICVEWEQDMTNEQSADGQQITVLRDRVDIKIDKKLDRDPRISVLLSTVVYSWLPGADEGVVVVLHPL